MKPSRITLILALLILPLFIYGGIIIGGADDQTSTRPPGASAPPASGAGLEGILAPGDLLWSCDVESCGTLADQQIIGVEFDGQYYYVQGGNSYNIPDDTNMIYIWERSAGTCNCVCGVKEYTTAVSNWGWGAMCFDGSFLYGAEWSNTGGTGFTVHAFTVDCDSVTRYPSHDITLVNPGTNFPTLTGVGALAYDRNNGWFWTADWNSTIYAFDRSGMLMDSIVNALNVHDLTYDDISPGGPYLWAAIWDDCSIRQIDLATEVYTGVMYYGPGGGSGNTLGAGLCLDRSGCGTLVGISQNTITGDDSLYAVELLSTTNITNLDTTYVPWATISQNSDDVPLLGFRIDCVQPGDCLENLTIRSFITKAFSVEWVKLYVETDGVKGLQPASDGLIVSHDARNLQFDSNDEITFSFASYCLNDDPGDSNLFYIAIDAHTDSVAAAPALYDGECLEVVIDSGGIELTSNQTNNSMIFNRPVGGVGDDSTGFCPYNLPIQGCRYRLCFDVLGPQFDLFFCVPHEEVCPGDNTVAQEDSVQICATNVSSDIKGPITIIDSRRIFLLDLIQLKIDDSTETVTDTCAYCDTNYNVIFQIPDKKNTGTYPGIDADTGQWMVCAWAEDSSGNVDTMCISHDDLPWKIDTRKPIIDSVTYELIYDANGDGIIALGDSIMVIGWGLSNPWTPELEVDSMKVNMDRFNLGWILLDDVLNNNRVFRKKIAMDSSCCIDTLDDSDCDVNINWMTVWAWDNACNYDTLRSCIKHHVDLEKPQLVDVVYEYYFDVDTTYACIGIGDQVKIEANVDGPDIASVTVDMKKAGIDEQNREALPLPYRSGTLYDTIWTVTEPPINDGKDRNNSVPPSTDSDFTVEVTVCDDADNCTTGVSGQLNRELDTRVPRPVGFNCPDTVPCALHVRSLAGGIIQLYWDRDCDENDAWMFYIYADDGSGTFDSVGSTYDDEAGNGTFNFWNSEPLTAGYYKFKIKTQDDCGNMADDYSCEVAAYADSTPPWACIVYPDNFGTYGAPFAVKVRADEAIHPDIDWVGLWYREWPTYPDSAGRGPWTECMSFWGMYRPDDGYVFFDTIGCIHNYQGWVELLPQACDWVGNCQDLDRAYDEACLDDSLQNIPVPGHFFFYWDTTRAVVRVVSVNDTISPQTPCGFNVRADTLNWVEIDVVGAEEDDLFTVDVRALADGVGNRILYRDHVTMPFIIDSISVENWPAGTQYLFVYVVEEATGDTAIPDPMIVDLCVPPQWAPCMEIVKPHEWMRVPCSKTDLTCVDIWAGLIEGCPDQMVTQVKFFWAKHPDSSWYFIDEVLEPDGDYWKTCWNNKEFLDDSTLIDGDAVYFIVIGYNQYHLPDTSHWVKVFLDCETPNVQLFMEPLYYTCGNETPKMPCGQVTFKAEVLDTLVDIVELAFFMKEHHVPDLDTNWYKIGDGEPAWSDNMWVYVWDPVCQYEEPDEAPAGGGTQNNGCCLCHNQRYDFRVSAKDQAGNMMYDYDEDGHFDDSTFNSAVAFGAGMTVLVDMVAPTPAISMVADTAADIYNVNPSEWLGGNGTAYVKAFDDITAEISVLPSEDSCEVMKVEWFLCFEGREPQDSPSQGGGSLGSNNGGDDCGDPIVVNLPEDMPFEDYNYTCERGDDYGGIAGQPTCLRPFDWGEDIIYQLNVTRPVYVDIILDPPGCPTYPGMLLTTECPPTENNCIDHVYWWVYGFARGFEDVLLTPGTYYVMIDNFIAYPGAPTCIEEFTLSITGEEMPCVHVGTSTDPYHYPVTFNPVTAGLIEPWELEDGWWFGQLKAVLHDSLGNYQEDMVGLYILDVTPSQAVIVEPLNDSYVSGDVTLRSLALNAYEICQLCYEYRPEGDSLWYPVNEGYPNACVTGGYMFELIWHTMNTVEDGYYYLRAVATDCSNNVDTLPPTIRVMVANGLPTVELEDPRICERECPDDTVDTLGYVSGTVTLYATAESDIPVDRMVFLYKNIFGYPDTYTEIGTDYFPTGGKYSVQWPTGSLADGRYHIKARVYNAAGRYADSDPVEVSVDNSAPFTQVVSIMGEPYPPDGIDISKGDIIDIEVWAMDSTSPEGWTRCYNSGVYTIEVCIEICDPEFEEVTKCFELDIAGDPPYDGFHTTQWNTSYLEFGGCHGCYYLYVKATDCLGNTATSSKVTVWVSDITAPITTIGGFDMAYIYGYSTEKVSSLLFEYADSGFTNWIPIGWSKFLDTLVCDANTGSALYLYMTSWDPIGSFALCEDSIYQIRVISHDTCSNQDDDMAPVAYFTVSGGEVIPYNPEVLGSMSFLKNWCVGGMHGVVLQDVEAKDPVMLARYLNSSGSFSYECVHMQAHLQNSTEYAGSFYARAIDDGGGAKFFSSVTVPLSAPPMTGEPAAVTYLRSGTFDVVKVKCDLGTHGVYQDGCVELTIPDGAIDCAGPNARYIWVSPTYMEWAPVTQPDLLPIGDDNGYATYVSFTDCYYCCGFGGPYFDGTDANMTGAGSADGSSCCFRNGKYAKIKMCYDSDIDVEAEHLAVAWWDCRDGEYCFDHIYYPVTVEGFDTENHTVEFATDCLRGPFVVVQLIERECDGSIVVRSQGIEPYCNGYTNSMPTFTTLITDNVQGTDAIDQSSIQFKIDLFNPGELIRIYDGAHYGFCERWQTGFGSFQGSGYDEVCGIFRAGWSDSTYVNCEFWCESGEDWCECSGCYWGYYSYDAYCAKCFPMYPLDEGDHIATVSAQNDMLNSCTQTLNFKVDATPPDVVWYSSYVLGTKPAFKFTITDELAGVNKDAIWIDIYDADESTQPYEKDLLLTIYPDGVDEFWQDDETLYVELTDPSNGHYMHVVIYDGNFVTECVEDDYCVRVYDGGVMDCVGNKASAEHLVFPVDRLGPICQLVTPTYANPVKIKVEDWLDTLWYEGSDGCPYHQYKVGSGLDVNSIQITENGVAVGSESFSFNSSTNILTYTPTVSGPIAVVVSMTDMVGNQGGIEFNNWDQDAEGPVIELLTELHTRPLRISITDAKSGVDWSTLAFYEDGLSLCEGFDECVDEEALSIDTAAGVVEYTPAAGGMKVEVRARDYAGNLSKKTFNTEEEKLAFTDPHNYPNPFDPRSAVTWICPGLSKEAHVTIKIYDFAGEYVTTLKNDTELGVTAEVSWDGTTEGGNDVANGTYLCYIKAKDPDGTRTAVIKITVLKEDK